MVWTEDEKSSTNESYGCESVLAVSNRLKDLLNDFTIESGVNKGDRYVLVSHGDVLQILQCICSNCDLKMHRSKSLKNCEIKSLKWNRIE